MLAKRKREMFHGEKDPIRTLLIVGGISYSRD